MQYVTSGLHDPVEAHNRIRGFYDWENVVERTEKVYDDVMHTEARGFWTRIYRCVAILYLTAALLMSSITGI